MVRIESLEMQGFKSFAKKTVVRFPSDFSVICGPNGSGKSNILDAIVFVLGRASAKSLRAGRMLEMIHKGRRASEFAKVKLWFDNSDKKFPLEDKKISISRRVNKRGVSIYKLNGKTVTREKILEVLRAGNIRPDGHNIILQGDITEVIEMSAIERREIIDEISGISEFEEKRTKAQRELQTVEDRLKESGIILSERERQLNKLETEAGAAKDYDRMTRELDRFRASLANKRLADAQEAMDALSEKVDRKEESLGKFNEQFDKIEKDLEKDEKEIEKIRQRLFDRTKDITLIKEVEQLRAEISKRRSRLEANETSIRRTEEVIARIKQLQQRQMQGSASRAVQEILGLGKPGIYGTILSLSKIPMEYQTAIEVAAGSHLHDIVATNKDTAIECVKHLKRKKIGRATFLPLDRIKAREPTPEQKRMKNKDGVIGFAIDLLDFERKYWHAFSHIFGNTLVVDRIDTAKGLGIGKARYVTLDGDLIERSGAIIGGFYRKERQTVVGVQDIKKYENDMKKLQKENKDIEGEIRKFERELKDLTSKERAGSKELEKAQKEREKIEQQLEQLRQKRKSIYEKRLVAQEEVNRLKVNRARLEAELENLKAEFEQFKGKKTVDMKPHAIQSKIKELVSSIQKLGPINQKAVEEYDNLKEVYDNLKGKVDKLTTERNRVLEMIADIEGRRRESFTRTMEEVAKQFSRIFNDLTGGQGSLRLEGEILEESGLIIEASPPGKPVLNIDSMSGGEKTLTALAFLFAIQQFKPAPFYILDEIDAALDKPNTKKITGLLKKYSDTAQFIVITHNDTTIKAAGCVYGISMEEGESKIVGIKMP